MHAVYAVHMQVDAKQLLAFSSAYIRAHKHHFWFKYIRKKTAVLHQETKKKLDVIGCRWQHVCGRWRMQTLRFSSFMRSIGLFAT